MTYKIPLSKSPFRVAAATDVESVSVTDTSLEVPVWHSSEQLASLPILTTVSSIKLNWQSMHSEYAEHCGLHIYTQKQ